MDIKILDKDLFLLIEKKMELKQLDYNSPDYDDLEEELHDLEDEFQEKYGDFLEDALHEVHDEYCPDSEVLLPIAYVPNEISMANESLSVDYNEGVYVEVDDYPAKETKLVIVPQPVRIILNIDKDNQVVAWEAK